MPEAGVYPNSSPSRHHFFPRIVHITTGSVGLGSRAQTWPPLSLCGLEATQTDHICLPRHFPRARKLLFARSTPYDRRHDLSQIFARIPAPVRVPPPARPCPAGGALTPHPPPLSPRDCRRDPRCPTPLGPPAPQPVPQAGRRGRSCCPPRRLRSPAGPPGGDPRLWFLQPHGRDRRACLVMGPPAPRSRDGWSTPRPGPGTPP